MTSEVTSDLNSELSGLNNHRYEGGFSESLNTLISLEPLGAEQANNPHMKA